MAMVSMDHNVSMFGVHNQHRDLSGVDWYMRQPDQNSYNQSQFGQNQSLSQQSLFDYGEVPSPAQNSRMFDSYSQPAVPVHQSHQLQNQTVPRNFPTQYNSLPQQQQSQVVPYSSNNNNNQNNQSVLSIDGIFSDMKSSDMDENMDFFFDFLQPQSCQAPVSPLSAVQDSSAQVLDPFQVDELTKELSLELISDASQPVSNIDSCSMSSENSPRVYARASQAVHAGFLDLSHVTGAATGAWAGLASMQQGNQMFGNSMKGSNSDQLMNLGNNRSTFGQLEQTFNYASRNHQATPGFGGNQSMASAQNIMGSMNGSSSLQPSSQQPATGLQLVHLLLACAEAVSEDNLEYAKVILLRLSNHVMLDGNPMQRLAAYFAQALKARLIKDTNNAQYKGLTGDKSVPQTEMLEAFSVFYDCIPIGKFGHLTCNQILLDAVERERIVHVVDLQIWHGMQWPAFLQALALRPGGPPKLRMTALGRSLKDLQETGEKLQECAKNLNVPFEFCSLLVEVEDFNPLMLELRRGEVVVVNSFVQFHCVLNKGPEIFNRLLRGLRALNPRVIAFAENDGNHNSPSFLTRFVECLRYYSAVFDAFDASLPPDSPARMKMEQIFAAQKIRNIIACEGPARVDGHESMRYWHKRLEAGGFRGVPLSSRAVSQANLLLNLYYSNGYTLTTDGGYLALGWHGMALMGVSAWQGT